jgi:hypothetical protein
LVYQLPPNTLDVAVQPSDEFLNSGGLKKTAENNIKIRPIHLYVVAAENVGGLLRYPFAFAMAW